MNTPFSIYLHVRCCLIILVSLGLFASSAMQAGVVEVFVGITPTCPDGGMDTCFRPTIPALRQLDGVSTVADTPDSYNCTAQVWIDHSRLPDVKKWQEHFRSLVGDRIAFRGIEVTVEGALAKEGETLVLKSEGLQQPLPLATLQHKLQLWGAEEASNRLAGPRRSAVERGWSSFQKASRGSLPLCKKPG